MCASCGAGGIGGWFSALTTAAAGRAVQRASTGMSNFIGRSFVIAVDEETGARRFPVFVPVLPPCFRNGDFVAEHCSKP
jgi:hypothetical protein